MLNAVALYNAISDNTGVGGSANTQNFGAVVDIVGNISENGSTEPAKRFYKYALPWRWSSSVVVVPALVPAKSSTPTTDGGFISGHTAVAVRGAQDHSSALRLSGHGRCRRLRPVCG